MKLLNGKNNLKISSYIPHPFWDWGIFIYMRFIITEEQHNRVINNPSRMWVLRRYDLVKVQLDLAFRLTRDNVCRYNTYEDFEYYFFSVLMDCLHPFFYEEYDFNYKAVQEFLTDLFYVECTEFYYKIKERC